MLTWKNTKWKFRPSNQTYWWRCWQNRNDVGSGNSLRQTVHTHRASVHQAPKLVAALIRVARVTAGLAKSNGSLPNDSRYLQADCQEPGSAPEPYARQSSICYLLRAKSLTQCSTIKFSCVTVCMMSEMQTCSYLCGCCRLGRCDHRICHVTCNWSIHYSMNYLAT